jgi:SAM-dependent methyltransferase
VVQGANACLGASKKQRMRDEHLQYLVCPECRQALALSDTLRDHDGVIETATLRCSACGASYPIIQHIPRFVASENYADSFGLQWSRHAKTQYDSCNGANASQTRFFGQTRWERRLEGEIVLEVGSGAGRFTEQALSTGALVLSLDYSSAVDVNYALNGNHPNLLLVQADLYQMPFPEAIADKVFCLGVLQHTPRVEEAFMLLPRFLKSGGSLVIDVYAKHGGFRDLLTTKYWVRPVARHLPPQRLYRFVQHYVTLMWPITKVIGKIPSVGRALNFKLLVPDFRGLYPLSDEQLKDWAILDSFDMLSPRFDSPQDLVSVQQWFSRSGFSVFEVERNDFGHIVEGRGLKP